MAAGRGGDKGTRRRRHSSLRALFGWAVDKTYFGNWRKTARMGSVAVRGALLGRCLEGSEESRLAVLEGRFREAGHLHWRSRAAALVNHPLVCLGDDVEPVFAELERGLSVEDVAKELGLKAQEVYRWVMEKGGDRWPRIAAARALERLEEGEKILDRAVENSEVSRGKAITANAQWMLERLASKVFGSKGEAAGVSIVVKLDRTCGGTVEIGAGGHVPAVIDVGSGSLASGAA